MALLRGSVPEPGLNPEEPPGWYLGFYQHRAWRPKKENVRNTDDLKPVLGDSVDEIGALHIHWFDGGRQWDGRCEEQCCTAPNILRTVNTQDIILNS